MKNTTIAASLAMIAMFATSCDLDVGSGTSSSELEAARSQATASNAPDNNTTPSTNSAQSDTSPTPASTSSSAAKPASTPTTTPVAKSAPAPAATPVSTGGALYQAGGNSLTLRSDFAAVARRVDALVNINESAPGVASSNAIPAVRSGNTWVIPQALASYPTGNRPNTWRISLAGTPPAGVTYHTSISQTFIRTTDFGTGKTYPPTTRR